MKLWNDLDRTIFFNKVFTYPVEIGEIKLFSLIIDNDRPNIILEFDIQELPDSPPEKWVAAGFNTCRIGISCAGLTDLEIKNIPNANPLKMVITRQQNLFEVDARSATSSIKFNAKYVSLCGPSVYFCDPDSACC
jgi:hypothetical protein